MADRLEIVRAFGAAWARRELDAVMAFFSEDCVYAASVGPEPGATFRGKAAVRAGIESMFRHDEGSTAEAGRVFASGDRAFSEWFYRFPVGSGRAPAHGCDLFEFDGDRIRRKEAFRKELAPLPRPAGDVDAGVHEIYRPRRFESRDAWAFGTKRFKPILISRVRDEPPFASSPETVAAAQAFSETLATEMDRQGGHFGLGYVVLHQGEAANWLLFDWWVSGAIACRILCRSGHAEPTRFERVREPFAACVWEALAIAHERDAWVETMMGERPDADGYLARRMPAGER